MHQSDGPLGSLSAIMRLCCKDSCTRVSYTKKVRASVNAISLSTVMQIPVFCSYPRLKSPLIFNKSLLSLPSHLEQRYLLCFSDFTGLLLHLFFKQVQVFRNKAPSPLLTNAVALKMYMMLHSHRPAIQALGSP